MRQINPNMECELQLKQKADAPNTMEVIVNVTGTMNSYGGVISPNAISTKVLSKFVKEGAILNAHNSEQVIGMPLTLKMDGTQLVGEMQFHSTGLAQDVRTICLERVSKGLKVPISLGYLYNWDKVVDFDNGADLWKYLEDNNEDTTLYDASIKKEKGWCYLCKEITGIREWSTVIGTNGADPKARATKVLADDKNSRHSVEDNDGGFPTKGDETMALSDEDKGFFATLFEKALGKNKPSDEVIPPKPTTPSDIEVQLAAMREENERLRAQTLAQTRLVHETAVENYIRLGKFAPAQRETLITLRQSNPEAFESLAATLNTPSKTKPIDASYASPKREGDGILRVADDPDGFTALAMEYYNEKSAQGRKN